MANIKKICIVTGARADYGLLFMLMRHIQDDLDLTLQIIATGSHYSPFHGLTYLQIEKDGFQIDQKIEILLANDSPNALSKSLALASIGFSDAYEKLKPDIVIVLGDRFEILAAVQTAMLAQIPIAHIHGGEITEGSTDDSIRHAITKMSHLHFVATDEYARRVIQMGEDPSRVFNCGAPGLDSIYLTSLCSRQELENILDFQFQEKIFLITYHPATLQNKDYLESATDNFLLALSNFKDVSLIFTKPNADVLGLRLTQKISNFVSNNSKSKLFDSLGQKYYYSLLNIVDAMIGNSSSGLIEAPIFNIPTVNIGSRQLGRAHGNSVINADDTYESIVLSIEKALNSDFRKTLNINSSPYGIGGKNSLMIKNILKETKTDGILLKKFKNI